jgi:hypothetical protein
MGLYNFKPRFRQPILEGKKRHTIRARRRHPDKPGNTMHLYTGLRTCNAELIARVQCTWVSEIRIGLAGAITVDGRSLSRPEREILARHDGFESLVDMILFWRDGRRLPFEGQIFGWAPLEGKP